MKVVKASFKIFNLFPISFLSFSWVFSRILTTKQSAIDSHFKCVWWSCFSYTQLPPSSPLKTSSVVIFFCSSKGREYERVKKERRKTNKIIYCLSICVIFFDYNSHISIIFFHHPILSSYAFSLFYRIFFLSKWTYQCKLTPGFFSLMTFTLLAIFIDSYRKDFKWKKKSFDLMKKNLAYWPVVNDGTSTQKSLSIWRCWEYKSPFPSISSDLFDLR